jgi:rubrerythrin
MLKLLRGFALPDFHELAPREAYQCSECNGISYPPDPDKSCPYCNEEED